MDDHFTSQIIAASLDAAAHEMFDVLRKTAMSPIIYEVLDVGTGITDAKGELVSSGAGIPSFIGVLDKTVRSILQKHAENIHNGDIFITNDPNHGGVTHLNDVVIAQPVFHQNELIAWALSIAHWGDIGGKTPGSMPVDVTDIFGEGLRLPNIKLVEKGKLNQSLLDIIKSNSRLPDFVEGDLKAQISAGQRAEKLIHALCNRYGASAIHSAINSAFDEGKYRALSGLVKLPSGRFEISHEQDDKSHINAIITITEELFEVDLRNNATQKEAPHNTSRDGTVIACQMFFKALTDPDRFANAGSFTPLKVITKPGTIFHAQDSAPHGYYFELRMQLFDTLWRCLAENIFDLLPAGHFASIFGTVIAGKHPDTGRQYTMVEPQMGGWGATSMRDGVSAMYSTSHGDTFNCPVEIAETRYGYEVIEKSLNGSKQLTNQRMGGRGVRTVYKLRNSTSFSVGMSHSRVPVWAIGNSETGGFNIVEIKTPDGQKQHFNFASGLKLDKDTEITIQTANGGSARSKGA